MCINHGGLYVGFYGLYESGWYFVVEWQQIILLEGKLNKNRFFFISA